MNKRLSELMILFVGIPVLLALPIYLIAKLLIGAIGLLYIVLMALKERHTSGRKDIVFDWRSFFKTLSFRFIIIAIVTLLMVYLISPESLFKVISTKPLLWLLILVVYSVLSVYPQELLYRPFFFNRYADLFPSKQGLIFMNALLFSLAHLFFYNVLVLVLTFVGGLIFAYTYFKTRSILLVTIEHAVYGAWLFTVGMGDMLGFPS